jgi:ABC-type lipoprotein release transport system permease subunit
MIAGDLDRRVCAGMRGPSLLAGTIPARRAMRLDPMTAPRDA